MAHPHGLVYNCLRLRMRFFPFTIWVSILSYLSFLCPCFCSFERRILLAGTFRDAYLMVHRDTCLHLHKSVNKIQLFRLNLLKPFFFCPITWTKSMFYWDFSLLNLLLYHSLEKHLKVSLLWKLFRCLWDLNHVCELHSALFYQKLSIYTSNHFYD